MPDSSLLSLSREIDRFLRSFDQDLRRAIVGRDQLQKTVKKWEPRRKSLEQKIQRAEKQDIMVSLRTGPSPYQEMLERLRVSFDRLILEHSSQAIDPKSLRSDGLARHYNRGVRSASSELANVDLDKEAKKGIKKGVEDLIKKYMGDEVPSDVRSKLATALANEAVKSPYAVEALYWAEEIIVKTATWLDRRLTLTREIGEIKKSVEKQKTITTEDTQAISQAVAPRAEAAAQLDKIVKKSIEETNLKFKAYFKIKPKFDLDPAVLFVKRVDLDMGFTLSNNSFQMKLGSGVRVTKPFTDPSVSVNPYLRTRYKPTGTSLDVEYRGNVTGLEKGNLSATLTQPLGSDATLKLGYSGAVNALDEGKVYGNLAWNINPNASLTAGYERRLNEHGSGTAKVGFKWRF